MTQFDPQRILRTLNEHRVAYVVIGGIAARLLGSPSITLDIDVCYERSRPNLEALAAALRNLGATLRARDQDLPFVLDAKTLEFGDNFTFNTHAGPLDCLGTPGGTNGYPDLARGATVVDLGGVGVQVCSLDDLIRMKRAAGRAKDRIELEVLGALRDEIDGEPP